MALTLVSALGRHQACVYEIYAEIGTMVAGDTVGRIIRKRKATCDGAFRRIRPTRALENFIYTFTSTEM